MIFSVRWIRSHWKENGKTSTHKKLLEKLNEVLSNRNKSKPIAIEKLDQPKGD